MFTIKDKFRVINDIKKHMMQTHNQHIWNWISTCHECIELRQKYISIDEFISNGEDINQAVSNYKYRLDIPEARQRNLGGENGNK